jgi:hypothetical protein
MCCAVVGGLQQGHACEALLPAVTIYWFQEYILTAIYTAIYSRMYGCIYGYVYRLYIRLYIPRNKNIYLFLGLEISLGRWTSVVVYSAEMAMYA